MLGNNGVEGGLFRPMAVVGRGSRNRRAAAIGLATGLRGLAGGRTVASSGLSYAEKLKAARALQVNFGKLSEAAANGRNANNPAFRPSAPVKDDGFKYLGGARESLGSARPGSYVQ
jgi:hypothetical protein